MGIRLKLEAMPADAPSDKRPAEESAADAAQPYDADVADALRRAHEEEAPPAERWTDPSGRYRRLYRLGGGGMATVDAALDTQTGLLRAVKIMRRDAPMQDVLKERFKREVMAIARPGGSMGQNPFVVRAHDVFTTRDGTSALVMDFMEEPDLAEEIGHEHRTFSDEFTASVAVQICLALAGAHAQGVLHRDLKPENIFVKRGERPNEGDVQVRVGDFGVALLQEMPDVQSAAEGREVLDVGKTAPGGSPHSRRTTKGGAARLTAAGRAVGSVRYMSPEVVLNNKQSERTDLYSLGLIMYQLLTGLVPLDSSTAEDIMIARAWQEPIPIDIMLSAGKETVLGPIIMKLLEREPRKRFESARETACAIKAVMAAQNPRVAFESPYLYVTEEAGQRREEKLAA